MTANIEAWERIGLRPETAPTDVSDIAYGPDASEAQLRLLGDVKGKRVLELGSGSGASAVALARRGASVFAVDAAASQLAQGRRLAEREEVRIEWHRSDLADLAFLRADSIDLALSIGVLDEVEDVARVFRQVHRVLRPSSAFVFSYEHPLSLAIRATDEGGTAPGAGASGAGVGASGAVIRRPYLDDSPVRIDVHGEPITVWPRPISKVFTELGRAGFRPEHLVEPAAPDALVPSTVVWRARKEGV